MTNDPSFTATPARRPIDSVEALHDLCGSLSKASITARIECVRKTDGALTFGCSWDGPRKGSSMHLIDGRVTRSSIDAAARRAAVRLRQANSAFLRD